MDNNNKNIHVKRDGITFWWYQQCTVSDDQQLYSDRKKLNQNSEMYLRLLWWIWAHFATGTWVAYSFSIIGICSSCTQRDISEWRGTVITSGTRRAWYWPCCAVWSWLTNLSQNHTTNSTLAWPQHYRNHQKFCFTLHFSLTGIFKISRTFLDRFLLKSSLQVQIVINNHHITALRTKEEKFTKFKDKFYFGLIDFWLRAKDWLGL